ncbi:conserved hypothetical protein [Neospora caninum Liverpool]|uniref:RING-type E3 ubiquitin transferase n=1 Tax=Neospora caninum (strain Liverpool) TaxID=572307 RepID=F0VDI6_NEOCL|nr:conserved hypothetical protein [Neospora caninum Liverpool]CBZ51779.1 conserved hypothetical protein [Neospora caninum Liverpool]CEL65736.1 TPA: hypothetical protein BN1204_015710 [Neospora caninum Liverpool]|eukprot:XP_003881812.1 conserved hypothetical protein [Neospora caninum Liverpool]
MMSRSSREGWSERRSERERESSSSSRRDRGGETRRSGGSHSGANEKSESYSSSRKRTSSSSSSSPSYSGSHSSDRSSRRHESEHDRSGEKEARVSSPSSRRPSSPRQRSSSSSSSSRTSSSSSAWPSSRHASSSWSRSSKEGYSSSSRREKSRSPSRRGREGSRESRFDRRQGSSRVYGHSSRSGSREGRRSTSAISDSREKDPLSGPAGTSDSEQEASRRDSRKDDADEVLYSSIAVLENIPENCTEEDVEERVRSVSISKGFSVPNGVTFAQMTPQDLRAQLGKASQKTETSEPADAVMTVAYVDFPSVDAAAKFRRSCRTGALFLFNRHCAVHQLPDRTAALEADAGLAGSRGRSGKAGAVSLRSESWACFRCNVYNVGSRACANCGAAALDADPAQASTGDTRGRGARGTGSGAKGTEAGVGGWGFDPVENPSAWMVVMDVLGLEVEDFLKAFRRASRKLQAAGEAEAKKSGDPSKGDSGSGASGRLEIQKCVYVEDGAKEGGGRPNHFLLLRFSASDVAIEGWKCVKSLVGKEVASQLCGARAQVLTRKEKQSMQEMLKIVEKTGSRDDSKDVSVLRVKLKDLQDIAKASSVYEQLLQQWQGLLLPLATNQPPPLTNLDEKSGYYYDASIDLYLDPTTNYYMTSVGDYYIHDANASALRRVCSYADQQKLLEQRAEGGRAKADGAGEAEGARGSGGGPSNPVDTVASLLAAAQKTARAAKDALERAKEQRGLDEEQKRQKRLQELQKLEDQHRQNMKQKQLQKQAACDAMFDESQAGYGHDPNMFTQNGYSAGGNGGGAFGRQMGGAGPEDEMAQNFAGRFAGSAPMGYGFPSGGAGASGVSPSLTSGVSAGQMGFTPPPPPPSGRSGGVPGKEGQQFFLPHQYGGENANVAGRGRGRGGRGGGFSGSDRVFEDSRPGFLGVSGIFERGGSTQEDEESLSLPSGQIAEEGGAREGRDAGGKEGGAGISGEKTSKGDIRDAGQNGEEDKEEEAFCFLCLRKFTSKESLAEHETKSKLHAWFVSEHEKNQHRREEKRKKEIELMQLLQLQLA